MSLGTGTRVGPYEIQALLGAGGMGEVYRARDNKLGRDVALKILPDVFAGDAERLARFEREARTLASLNHPHIAHLHGIEEAGPTRALVMEMVDGEDLAARIQRGPIPMDEALAIAKQIAQALGAAHEQGIIHRDLKPANIKVRDDGTVKVLDFGLAKALDKGSGIRDQGSGNDADSLLNSPTITSPAMTMRGMILGTAAYMSPEQAKGKTVDKRADIWAFGCVLYEMLTSRRAFAGDDVSDTLASVLRAEVDWTGVPPSVVRLLKKCLERDPRHRMHDIADAWDLIDAPNAVKPVARRPWLAWSVAALLGIATTALALLHFRERPAPSEIVRFQVQPPPKNTFDIYLSLSPDGRRLAFTARDEAGVVRLWVRDLDSLEARQLSGTEDAWSPFWSPDSRHLAFGVNRTLKRIDVSGGPPQTLGESPAIVGVGTWNADGVILFGTRGVGVLRLIPASGGVPVEVTAIDASHGETFHSFPFFLPDGQHFLYLRQSNDPARQGIYVGSLDVPADRQSTNRLVPALLGPVQATFGSSGGHIFYLRDRTLLAQPFDSERHQMLGDAVPVAEGVGSSGSFGFFSASTAGVMAYRAGFATFANMQQLTWVDRTGRAVGTVGDPQPFSQALRSVMLSPDGTRAVAAIAPQPNADLWLIEFARGVLTRFTFNDATDNFPVWAPDGSRIAFRSNRVSGDIFVRDTNGATDERPLLETPVNETPTDWSRDGRFLLVMQGDPAGQDVGVLAIDTAKEVVPLLSTTFDEADARFSPDGRWIAYTSNESGRPEIYLRTFTLSDDGKPRVGGKWQASNRGGVSAHWRGDGKELFYREPTGSVISVEVPTDGGTIRTGQPNQLFTLAPNVVQWDASADGQRFLVGIPVASPTSDPITVMLNWQAARNR